ncbi:MAG: hypothetical protein E7Z91_04035 [Cyanobacteria bacterium SIG30]|nr:hypothetical protein [Cyanobacteria bacterium SIG30]
MRITPSNNEGNSSLNKILLNGLKEKEKPNFKVQPNSVEELSLNKKTNESSLNAKFSIDESDLAEFEIPRDDKNISGIVDKIKEMLDKCESEVSKSIIQAFFNPPDPLNENVMEIKDKTEITDENKDEVIEKFNFVDADELFEKYDAEVITTEDGKSIIRFKDKDGKTIVDYVYETDENGNLVTDKRTKVEYHYNVEEDDGTYIKTSTPEEYMKNPEAFNDYHWGEPVHTLGPVRPTVVFDENGNPVKVPREELYKYFPLETGL